MNDFPQRKRIRLKNYDYSQNGYYFVTICTKDKQPILWNNVGADIIRPSLSEIGLLVDTAINEIPKRYPGVKIDQYVIMPNHIHLILILSMNDGCGRIISAPTLMTVIGQMKRWVSKQSKINVWQKSYYEHVIRNDNDYALTLEYICNNPLKLRTYPRQRCGKLKRRLVSAPKPNNNNHFLSERNDFTK